MKRLVLGLLTGVVVLGWGSWASASVQVGVDIELSLLVDVSGSISADDFTTQRDGYAAAFNDADVVNAITGGSLGQIAVNVVYWSGPSQQMEVVPWTLIHDATSASAFAAAISATSRQFQGSTAIGAALEFATPLFASNDFDGTRSVIDVSGDGVNIGSPTSADARAAALLAGIDTINGLVINHNESVFNHYVSDVTGGIDPFVIWITDFTEFGPAVKTKILGEAGPSPAPVAEPASLAIWAALGCLGLVFLARPQSRRTNRVA